MTHQDLLSLIVEIVFEVDDVPDDRIGYLADALIDMGMDKHAALFNEMNKPIERPTYFARLLADRLETTTGRPWRCTDRPNQFSIKAPKDRLNGRGGFTDVDIRTLHKIFRPAVTFETGFVLRDKYLSFEPTNLTKKLAFALASLKPPPFIPAVGGRSPSMGGLIRMLTREL